MNTNRQKLINNIVTRIVENFSPDKIILFGSLSNGNTTVDSDIDLLIIMHVEGSCRMATNKIDLLLCDRTVPMDLIVITPEQFDRQKEIMGTIFYNAAHEGIILYEQVT